MDIHKYTEAIGKLTEWESSGEAFGFIINSEKEEDYIYEFFCAMVILDDLKKNHRIKLVPGLKGYCFAKKGGLKKNFSKFLILDESDSEVLFQICLGTEIYLENDSRYSFRADISLQKGDSPDRPNENHLILIMDAKYTSKNSTLGINNIKEFYATVIDFRVPTSESNKLHFSKYGWIKSNCLLTNGKVNKKNETYCKSRKITQVGNFSVDLTSIDVIGYKPKFP